MRAYGVLLSHSGVASMFKRTQLSAAVFISFVGPALAGSEEVTMVSCSVCHGPTVKEMSIPTINGQDKEELLALLLSFTSSDSITTIMHRFLVGMSSEELDRLAAYISGLGTTR